MLRAWACVGLTVSYLPSSSRGDQTVQVLENRRGTSKTLIPKHSQKLSPKHSEIPDTSTPKHPSPNRQRTPSLCEVSPEFFSTPLFVWGPLFVQRFQARSKTIDFLSVSEILI